MDIIITVSTGAGSKFNTLALESKKEVNALVDDLILTMPVEPTDAPAWPTCDPKTRHSSKDGSQKNSSPSSSVLRNVAASVLLICWTALSPLTSNAAPSKKLVSDKFLHAVMLVESNGRAITGDNGNARGHFQFWRRTWDHVTSIRRKANLPTYGYSAANNLLQSQAYARTYFEWLEKGLKRNGCTHPTHADLYAAFNLGLAGYKKRGFDLSRCPTVTRRAVVKLKKNLK